MSLTCPVCGADHANCRGAAPDPAYIIGYGGTMASNLYTADRRLYLNTDGKVVEADDPTRRTLLVGVGGTLLLERAQALGLMNEPDTKAADAPEMAAPAEAETATKAADAPPATKARRPQLDK